MEADYSKSSQSSSSKRFPQYGSTFKERLRLLVDEPTSGMYAVIFSIIIGFSIILNSTATVIETLPHYTKQVSSWSFFIDSFCGAIFTFEFIIRFWANSSTSASLLKWSLSLFTIIDILSLLPFYIYLFTKTTSDGAYWYEMQNIGVLRLFKLLKIFRCYNYSSMLQLSMDALLLAIRKSTDTLIAMVVFFSFMLITFSTLIYYLERGTFSADRNVWLLFDGNESKFNSIPASMYFVIEVITTVGLGDCKPVTWQGKLCTSFLMVLSLLFMALPSILIGRNYSESWAWLRSTRPHRLKAKSRRINPLTRRPFNEDHLTTMTEDHHNHEIEVDDSHHHYYHHHHHDEKFQEISSSSNVNNNKPVVIDIENEGSPIQSSPLLQVTSPQLLPSHSSISTISTVLQSNNFDDHGNINLAILEELQRQNELLERLLASNLDIKSHQKKSLGIEGILGSINSDDDSDDHNDHISPDSHSNHEVSFDGDGGEDGSGEDF